MPLVIPKKDEDLVMLLKEGEGEFETLNAISKISSKGDEMIELMLKCWDYENKEQNIFDYLIFNENKFNQRKIKHYCYCVGLEKEYESGTFILTPEKCLKKYGKIIVGIQEDKTGKYPPKNCVNDYLKQEENKITGLNDSLDDIAF